MAVVDYEPKWAPVIPENVLSEAEKRYAAFISKGQLKKTDPRHPDNAKRQEYYNTEKPDERITISRNELDQLIKERYNELITEVGGIPKELIYPSEAQLKNSYVYRNFKNIELIEMLDAFDLKLALIKKLNTLSSEEKQKLGVDRIKNSDVAGMSPNMINRINEVISEQGVLKFPVTREDFVNQFPTELNRLNSLIDSLEKDIAGLSTDVNSSDFLAYETISTTLSSLIEYRNELVKLVRENENLNKKDLNFLNNKNRGVSSSNDKLLEFYDSLKVGYDWKLEYYTAITQFKNSIELKRTEISAIEQNTNDNRNRLHDDNAYLPEIALQKNLLITLEKKKYKKEDSPAKRANNRAIEKLKINIAESEAKLLSESERKNLQDSVDSSERRIKTINEEITNMLSEFEHSVIVVKNIEKNNKRIEELKVNINYIGDTEKDLRNPKILKEEDIQAQIDLHTEYAKTFKEGSSERKVFTDRINEIDKILKKEAVGKTVSTTVARAAELETEKASLEKLLKDATSEYELHVSIIEDLKRSLELFENIRTLKLLKDSLEKFDYKSNELKINQLRNTYYTTREAIDLIELREYNINEVTNMINSIGDNKYKDHVNIVDEEFKFRDTDETIAIKKRISSLLKIKSTLRQQLRDANTGKIKEIESVLNSLVNDLIRELNTINSNVDSSALRGDISKISKDDLRVRSDAFINAIYDMFISTNAFVELPEQYLKSKIRKAVLKYITRTDEFITDKVIPPESTVEFTRRTVETNPEIQSAYNTLINDLNEIYRSELEKEWLAIPNIFPSVENAVKSTYEYNKDIIKDLVGKTSTTFAIDSASIISNSKITLYYQLQLEVNRNERINQISIDASNKISNIINPSGSPTIESRSRLLESLERAEELEALNTLLNNLQKKTILTDAESKQIISLKAEIKSKEYVIKYESRSVNYQIDTLINEFINKIVPSSRNVESFDFRKERFISELTDNLLAMNEPEGFNYRGYKYVQKDIADEQAKLQTEFDKQTVEKNSIENARKLLKSQIGSANEYYKNRYKVLEETLKTLRSNETKLSSNELNKLVWEYRYEFYKLNYEIFYFNKVVSIGKYTSPDEIKDYDFNILREIFQNYQKIETLTSIKDSRERLGVHVDNIVNPMPLKVQKFYNQVMESESTTKDSDLLSNEEYKQWKDETDRMFNNLKDMDYYMLKDILESITGSFEEQRSFWSRFDDLTDPRQKAIVLDNITRYLNIRPENRSKLFPLPLGDVRFRSFAIASVTNQLNLEKDKEIDSLNRKHEDDIRVFVSNEEMNENIPRDSKFWKQFQDSGQLVEIIDPESREGINELIHTHATFAPFRDVNPENYIPLDQPIMGGQFEIGLDYVSVGYNYNLGVEIAFDRKYSKNYYSREYGWNPVKPIGDGEFGLYKYTHIRDPFVTGVGIKNRREQFDADIVEVMTLLGYSIERRTAEAKQPVPSFLIDVFNSEPLTVEGALVKYIQREQRDNPNGVFHGLDVNELECVKYLTERTDTNKYGIHERYYGGELFEVTKIEYERIPTPQRDVSKEYPIKRTPNRVTVTLRMRGLNANNEAVLLTKAGIKLRSPVFDDPIISDEVGKFFGLKVGDLINITNPNVGSFGRKAVIDFDSNTSIHVVSKAPMMSAKRVIDDLSRQPSRKIYPKWYSLNEIKNQFPFATETHTKSIDNREQYIYREKDVHLLGGKERVHTFTRVGNGGPNDPAFGREDESYMDKRLFVPSTIGQIQQITILDDGVTQPRVSILLKQMRSDVITGAAGSPDDYDPIAVHVILYGIEFVEQFRDTREFYGKYIKLNNITASIPQPKGGGYDRAEAKTRYDAEFDKSEKFAQTYGGFPEDYYKNIEDLESKIRLDPDEEFRRMEQEREATRIYREQNPEPEVRFVSRVDTQVEVINSSDETWPKFEDFPIDPKYCFRRSGG